VSANSGHDPRYTPPVTRGRGATDVLHALAAVVGWAAFGFFWYEVFYRTPPAESATGILVVAVLLLVSVSLTAAWIRHNLVLARRYAFRRRWVREVEPDFSRDVLGRPVAGADWETLMSAPEVEIDLDPVSGRKIYRAF